jgi:hypothetical protein
MISMARLVVELILLAYDDKWDRLSLPDMIEGSLK